MFKDCYRIDVNSNLGKDVEEIGEYAFYNSGLNGEYTTGSKLKKIGNNVFQYSLINKLNITGNVEEIGTYAFANTKLNGTFTLPSTVTTYGNNILNDTNITELIIPDAVRSLPQNTFGTLANLKKLTVPIDISMTNRVSTTKLEELHLTKGTTGIGYNYTTNNSYENGIKYTPWYTSREYGGASATSVGESPLKVTIDEGITKIGNNLFKDCYRIQLQSSIDGITIGTDAFTNSGVNL